MPKANKNGAIPTQVDESFFNEFILPHIILGRRGPPPKIPLLKVFNYILYCIYTGCQWKSIPIDKGPDGKAEIHYTRLHRIFRRWTELGVFEECFINSVKHLEEKGMLDLRVLHGDGTTTAAKKGATI